MDLWRLAWQSVGGSNTAAPSVGSSFETEMLALTPTTYYRLGEPSGTAAVDAMGVQNGVYTGSPTLAVSGYAAGDTGVTFNGSSQYVVIADNAAWDIGTGDFSACVAVKLSSWPAGSQFLIARGVGTAGNWTMYLNGAATDRVSFRIDSNYYDIDSSISIATGDWVLLSISADRSGLLTLYVDGVSAGTVDISADVSSDLTSTDALGLACQDAGGTPSVFFAGSLDEFAFWNSTLISGAQWAALHTAKDGSGGTPAPSGTYDDAVLALGPVAFYKMDEASGTVMSDSSTTANHGVYVNAPALGVAGPFTGALGVTFDGTDWATAPYTAALDLGTADFSIVLWIKRATQTAHDEWLLQRSPDGFDVLELSHWWEDEDKFGMRFTNAGETDTAWPLSTGTYALDDGSWHMIAMTADRDGNATFYVDNVVDGTTDISSYVHELDGSYTLYIARRGVAGHEWDGTMSRLAIFDSLLTAGEIDDLWTAAGGA